MKQKRHSRIEHWPKPLEKGKTEKEYFRNQRQHMQNPLVYKCKAGTDVDGARRHSDNANGLMNTRLKVRFVVFTLLAENATAHLEHRFETLPAS